MMKVAEVLPKRLRESHEGEKSHAFAKRCGVKPQQLSRYESGEQLPGADRLAVFARAAGVSADWLLGLSDERTPRASAPSVSASATAPHATAIAESGLLPADAVADLLRRVLASQLPNPTEQRLAALERGLALVADALQKLPAR